MDAEGPTRHGLMEVEKDDNGPKEAHGMDVGGAPTRRKEQGSGREKFRGKITEYFKYTPALKIEMDQRRRQKLKGVVELEKEDVETGGGNDEATRLEWKRLMSNKPNNGIDLNQTTKFKKGKGKPKFRGAKSGTGKGPGSKGRTDSSQLMMMQFFCPEARGTPLGVARTNDANAIEN